VNNLRFNHVSQIVINNDFNLLLKKHISFEKLKENLYKHLSKNKVDNFFEEKEECDDRMIIALSKELNENINYFVTEHNPDLSLNIKEEKLLELLEITGKNFDLSNIDFDNKLLKLTKEALQKELITMSYASYLLNKNISEIMELDNE
jgi:hypothetical protein